MSLDFADLSMSLDDAFGLNFHEIDVSSHRELIPSTVGQLHALIVGELSRRGPVDSNFVWAKICQIVGNTLHKDPASIHPQHRFVEDLGMN